MAWLADVCLAARAGSGGHVEGLPGRDPRALVSALEDFAPAIILGDFSLPLFDGMSALAVAKQLAPRVPFVFLSGTIGEEKAIETLRAGAIDYVLKDNLGRLAPAVRRAMREAAEQAERKRQEAQIARLDRVLHMLSGIIGLVLRIRGRTELLRETCRLAVTVGGYSVAVAAADTAGSAAMQPVAEYGIDEAQTASLRRYIGRSLAREGSVLSSVVRTGREFVCNNTSSLVATTAFDSLMLHTGMLSVVALPLSVDNTVIALLVLTARDQDVVGDEELSMLREVAGNLSFALQYIQTEKRARFLSHFDPQSGLAKRSLFCERVFRVIGRPQGQKLRFAVIVIDIEQLSVINDGFGRRVGDLVLQHVAARLKELYPRTEQIAHFGGGTFALLRDQGERTEEEINAHGVHQTARIFQAPFVIEGRSIPLSVRTGFALFPEDGTDASALVQNAEAALHFAQATGARHVRYTAAASLQSVGRLALEHRLRSALQRGEFELHYQPKVDIGDGSVRDAEALLRWRSPEDGLVYPGAFLPTLESSGLVGPVGDWVVSQAARDCRAWQAAGLPPVRIAVNIAPAQLHRPDFSHTFLEELSAWSTPDCGLDVEIVEEMLQEGNQADVQALQRLREAGVRIAIDDFGTGYSSLGRLAALPIDTLKIDRSFVRQALQSASGANCVRTIVELARGLGMTTVGEGVGLCFGSDPLVPTGSRIWRRCTGRAQSCHPPAVPLLGAASWRRSRCPYGPQTWRVCPIMEAALDLSIPDLCYPHLLRGALDACQDHVLITNRTGRIVFANAALARSHGCSREDLVGRPASTIMPTELNLEQMERIRDAYRREQSLHVVAQGRHASGSPVWVSMVINPMPDPEGRTNHFVSIGTDITRQVQDDHIKQELRQRILSQEQEHERMSVELRLAQKLEAVGRLAAGVAHEINTPIQYISDNVTFTRSSLADLARVLEAYRTDPSQAEQVAQGVDLQFLLQELPKALNRTRDGIERVVGIVRAMREYSHPGSTERSFADINQALENTLAIARSEYKHLATIEKVFDPVPLVMCNIGELNQVFLNILVNAAHAIEQAGRDSSSGLIRIHTAQLGAEVVVAFEDNGCGIPTGHVEKIFDPFFTTKEVGKGTGQGLSIARAIVVDRHGGSIDVDSREGIGTVFKIRLPVALAKPTSVTQPGDRQ